jgi:PAS domain S-box-containing protein
LSAQELTVANAVDGGGIDEEQRLRREARRYQALISSEGSIVWVLTADLRVTGRCIPWEIYTGQRPDEYSGLGWFSAIHPDDRDRVRSEAAPALAAGNPLATELRVRRADGEYRRNAIRAVPVREEDTIVEWIGTAMDVEDARRAGDEQRDLRARLLALTDASESVLSLRTEEEARAAVIALTQHVLPGDACAIWWFEPSAGEWRIVQSRGLPPEYISARMPGRPVPFVHPVSIPDLRNVDMPAALRDVYEREGIRSLLTVPIPIGSERRATLVIYYKSRHEATETELRVAMALAHIAGAALWNAEVYETQQRARLAAERHLARMSFLADASALLSSLDYESTLREVAQLAVPRVSDWCAVDVAQSDGTLERIVTTHVDPAKLDLARRLAEQYPVDPAAPYGALNVFRTGVAELHQNVTDELLVADARDPRHLEILRQLGIRSVLQAPLTARGTTLGVISFIRSSEENPFSDDDVTVLTEVARRAAIAIDNARLYRDAELANRAKDEFLAILSHELRTPLNAIMGWSHMLREGLSADMTRHAIEVIGRNARAQKQLVEDLLDVARIASGRLELRSVPLDLTDISRVAVDSALPAAHAKKITLSFAGSEPVPIVGDANRLQQVLANLISNALKFTDAGGRVTVSVARRSGRAELAVADTGIGMSPEFLPSAFDRFRQADSSLTRPYPGLGLGLWLVKEIVDAHGGHVHAESRGHGHGSTVTVSLPLA